MAVVEFDKAGAPRLIAADPVNAKIDLSKWKLAQPGKPVRIRLSADAADAKTLFAEAKGRDTWIRRAAEQGLPEAQAAYGQLLRSGKGSDGVDLVRAVGYLTLADRAGFAAAKAPLESIRPAVHEDVLSLGEEFADTFVRTCEEKLDPKSRQK
jgi:hypothetical protein